MTGLEDLPHLNPTELELMKLLWRQGRLSAREIHEQLGADHGWALNTTRTTVERMVRKGHLDRSEFHGILLYSPAVSRPQGLARLVGDFARSVLELDPALVVSLFAQGETLSAEEIDELARIIEVDRDESNRDESSRGRSSRGESSQARSSVDESSQADAGETEEGGK